MDDGDCAKTVPTLGNWCIEAYFERDAPESSDAFMSLELALSEWHIRIWRLSRTECQCQVTRVFAAVKNPAVLNTARSDVGKDRSNPPVLNRDSSGTL
jgi:hypothetical protein